MSNRLWPNRISLIRTWKAVSSGNPAVTLNGIPSRVEREALFGVFSISRCRTSGVEIDLSPAWLLLQGGGYTRPLSLFRQLEFFFFFLFFFHRALNCSRRKRFKKKKRVTFVAKLYFCKNFELFVEKQKLYKLIISLSVSKGTSYVFLFDQLEEVDIRKIFGRIDYSRKWRINEKLLI